MVALFFYENKRENFNFEMVSEVSCIKLVKSSTGFIINAGVKTDVGDVEKQQF